MNFMNFIFPIILMVIVIIVQVLLGRYVYRDSKSRGMDPVLWTVVAVLVPSMVGLIIYLVIRNNNTNVSCPSCHNSVSLNYVICPYCGKPLKNLCKNCNFTLENNWKLCPKCGTEITDFDINLSVSSEIKEKNNWIIVLVIAVPVIIMFLGFLMMGIMSVSAK